VNQEPTLDKFFRQPCHVAMKQPSESSPRPDNTTRSPLAASKTAIMRSQDNPAATAGATGIGECDCAEICGNRDRLQSNPAANMGPIGTTARHRVLFWPG
jgi:hypothetical protein